MLHRVPMFSRIKVYIQNSKLSWCKCRREQFRRAISLSLRDSVAIRNKQLDLSIFSCTDLLNCKTWVCFFFFNFCLKGLRIKWDRVLGKSFVNFKALHVCTIYNKVQKREYLESAKVINSVIKISYKISQLDVFGTHDLTESQNVLSTGNTNIISTDSRELPPTIVKVVVCENRGCQ